MIKILVVSDLHAGHKVGLWHPEAPVQDREINLNKQQRYLYDCWLDLYKKMKVYKPDIMVTNGDLIDGCGRKSLGAEQITTLSNSQVNAAVLLLSDLRDLVREVYVVEGTPYHVRIAGQGEDQVGQALGAVRPNRDWAAWNFLDLAVGRTNLNFSHGISTSTGFYRATALDREGIFSALAGREGKLPAAHVVVRSHVHYFTHVEHESKHIVVTPAWQLQTAYMRKNSVYRLLPTIGVILIEIDNKVPKWDDPVEIKKIRYPLPAATLVQSKVPE